MSNPNQRIQGAFGDIFTPNTSYTDRAAQNIYAEEKQRAAQQQAKNAALDDEFSKNMAKIKDIDVPDFTKAYGDWKIANQQLLKQKGATPQDQLNVLRKKSDVYKILNGSVAQKQKEDEYGKAVLTNPDKYADDAHDTLVKMRNTPTSQLGDLANADLSYKGTDTDFSKINATASGQLKQVHAKEAPLDGGLQTQITPYMFGNTPAQYKDSILGSLSQHKAGRDAAAIVSNWSPEVIKSVQDQYQAIPPEKWEKMGIDKPQDLTILPTDSKAEIFAKHQAQLYAINNEPKEGTPVFRTNEAAKMNKQLSNEKVMEGIRQAGRKELEGMRETAKAAGTSAENLWIDSFLDRTEQESRDAVKGSFLSNTFPKAISVPVKANAVLYKALGEPSDIKLLPNNKYKVTYTNDDGTINETKSGDFTRDDIKLSLGYKAAGKKQLTAEMNNNSGSPKPPSVKPTAPARKKVTDPKLLKQLEGK